MQERMAASANVDAAFGHIILFKIFSKPLVAMAGLRYQVMECNKMFATTKHTGFVQLARPAKILLGGPVTLHFVVKE